MIENRVKSGGKYTLTSTTNSATYAGSNYLYGSDNTTMTSASGDSYYYKLTYGNGGSSNVFGWYWGSRDGSAFTIEGHKAWLAIPKSNIGSRAFSAEGEAMDIHEVSGDESDATYYDLQGRAVGSPVRNGLYIKNGKKVVVNKMK